jgi:hypothetical protein
MPCSKMTRRFATVLLVAGLWSCEPTSAPAPVLHPTPTEAAPSPSPKLSNTPTATPSAIPESEKPFLAAPSATPILSKPGYDLIIEFEVGGRSGYDPHPEAPDERYSGITIGLGYDLHMTTKVVILDDWQALGSITVGRLAATQPYYGKSAKAHLHEVHDIIISWAPANDVFMKIDVPREYARARKALPGFEALRPNAQAALISLIFNRGASMVGDNRKEMRAIRDLVPKKDYAGMAVQFRAMIRVWRGTTIERGMTRRRLAEAKLMETP